MGDAMLDRVWGKRYFTLINSFGAVCLTVVPDAEALTCPLKIEN
jgi:hypothetical protein